MTRKPHNARWLIVSVNKPVMMRRSDDETWLLNPRRRYVLNADTVEDLSAYIETMSDLEGSAFYKPIRTAPKVRLPGASLLIERYRDRGIGDILFTTGPLAYLNHITGGALRAYYYTYAERGSILNYCPYLADNSPLVGPILYDELPQYDYHWFIDAVTEYCEEPDQLNVYDALFENLGAATATVDRRFKRPLVSMSASETKALDDFYYWIFVNSKIRLDLRNSGYYVVAPLANSSTRCAPYNTWLQVIATLSERRPVLVVGAMRDRMPSTDMTVGDFCGTLDNNPAFTTGRVVNLLGKTNLRHLVQLISKANCVASLDSGVLYIAQGLRVPCVSLWGSHAPAVRLGYDPEYMSLALWEQRACRHSPCFAWQNFPAHKCPMGEVQTTCECQSAIAPEQVTRLFDQVEALTPKTIRVSQPQAEPPNLVLQ
jgi:ADP-heptose:LPS heptosyltransferase